MSKNSLNAVVQYIRRVASIGYCPASDAGLLDRFAHQGDELAFELLVSVHGPMVLGLCRRLLRHEQDAEDAFQATFLALARKAATISNKESLASWLYKVAYRVACRVRVKVPELTNRRPSVLDRPDSDGDADAVRRDLRFVLDQEVAALSECYRRAIVLCYFEGKSHEEAARLLSCPKGTVATRLARAREQLRRRLSRRGWALSTGLFATVMSETAFAVTLPAGLLRATVQSAVAFTSAKTITAGIIAANVLTLSEGALHMLWLSKMKLTASVVLAVVLAGSGIGLAVRQTRAGAGADDAQVAADDPPAQNRKTAAKAATQSDTKGEIASLRSENAALLRKLDSALKENKRLQDLLSPGNANKAAPEAKKEKNWIEPFQNKSIRALFDGIPADMESRVIANGIRRDRVNDWLQAYVNGKGKVVKVPLQMKMNASRAKDGTYSIGLHLDDGMVNVLYANWHVRALGVNERAGLEGSPFSEPGGGGLTNFRFEGVSAADAENLGDMQQVTIQGTVKEATLEPLNNGARYYIRLVLENVQVNGKTFTPRESAVSPNGRGRGGKGKPG